MRKRNASWAWGVVGLALAMGVRAEAVTLDFDSFTHGDVVSDQLAGVTIIADNANNDIDLAVAFDSRIQDERSRFRDLVQSPNGAPFWSGGNIQDEALDVLLVLQKNGRGCADGNCDAPDDEGRRPAGSLSFVFAQPILSFGLDVVDIENLEDEPASLVFFHSGGSEEVDLGDLIDPDDFGDRTANRISPLAAGDLGLAPGTSFTEVRLMLGGSGAIDNVSFEVVPEPTTAALFVGGLIGLALATPRRRPRG